MLGGNGICQSGRFIQLPDQNDRAEIPPRGTGDRTARQRLELTLDRTLNKTVVVKKVTVVYCL